MAFFPFVVSLSNHRPLTLLINRIGISRLGYLTDELAAAIHKRVTQSAISEKEAWKLSSYGIASVVRTTVVKTKGESAAQLLIPGVSGGGPRVI